MIWAGVGVGVGAGVRVRLGHIDVVYESRIHAGVSLYVFIRSR